MLFNICEAVADVGIYGDKAEKLERILRREFGFKQKDFNERLRELGDYKKYSEWLENELEKRRQKDGLEEVEVDIDLIDKPIKGDIEAEKSEPKIKDEAIIEILKYLAWQLHNKDLVRVIAARFHIDPDIYSAAGLGHLPENYTDEDVWKTMKKSGYGRRPFKDSIWQPYYIRAKERFAELSQEVKDEIIEIMQKHKENKQDVGYPVSDPKEYDIAPDERYAYENKSLQGSMVLLENIFDKNQMLLYPKYSHIIVAENLM